MDESNIVDLLGIETIAPKHRMIRSPGAIYIALILLIICGISLGNLLYDRFQISRYITQPILYALIAIGGFVLYQRCNICFRYTLTNETFAIERIASGEKTLGAIPIHDITLIRRAGKKDRPNGKIIYAALPASMDITWVKTFSDEVEITFAIGASEEFTQKLINVWQKTTDTRSRND